MRKGKSRENVNGKSWGNVKGKSRGNVKRESWVKGKGKSRGNREGKNSGKCEWKK